MSTDGKRDSKVLSIAFPCPGNNFPDGPWSEVGGTQVIAIQFETIQAGKGHSPIGPVLVKYLLIALACGLLLLGLLFWLTPLPGGTPAIAVGLAILICTSERAARIVVKLRMRFTRVNNALAWIENAVPDRLADALRRTRPPTQSAGT